MQLAAVVYWIKKEHRFSELLRWAFLLHAVATTVMYSTVTAGDSTNGLSLLLTWLLDALLIALTFIESTRRNPTVLLLLFFNALFFLPRLYAYFFLPEHLLNYPFPDAFTAEDLNRALVYVILGNGCLAIGATLAARLADHDQAAGQKANAENRIEPFDLGVMWFVVWAVDLYIFAVKGVTAYNIDRSPEVVSGLWLIHLFSIDVAAFMIVSYCLFTWPKDKAALRLAVFVTLAYIIYLPIAGSRSAPLRIAFIVLMTLFVLQGDFRVTLKRAALFCAVIVILSLVSFGVGTIARYHHQRLTISDAFVALRGEFTRRPRQGIEPPASDLQKAVAPLLTRLGGLDYPVEILADRGDKEAARRYLSLTYNAKNFVNNMVLGTPFPEAEIMTSRLFTVIYRKVDLETVRRHIQSDTWTAWGLSYALAGWLGGLGLLVLAGFVSQTCLDLLRRIGGTLAWGIVPIYVYYFASNSVLHAHGIDYMLTVPAYTALATVTALSIAFGCMGIRRAVTRASAPSH